MVTLQKVIPYALTALHCPSAFFHIFFKNTLKISFVTETTKLKDTGHNVFIFNVSPSNEQEHVTKMNTSLARSSYVLFLKSEEVWFLDSSTKLCSPTRSRLHSGSFRYIGDQISLVVVLCTTLFLRSSLFLRAFTVYEFFLGHFTTNCSRALSRFTGTFEKFVHGHFTGSRALNSCSRALLRVHGQVCSKFFTGSFEMFTGTFLKLFTGTF